MWLQIPVLSVSFLLLTLVLTGSSCEPHEPELTVRTTTGTFTGLVNSTTPDVNQWLGILYGRPPLGNRRFMPPEKAPDHGDADAKAYKPICMQQSGDKTGGGGYALYQVPDQWIQRTQTHLVVTFNYRLNIFGFPGSPAANLNVGFLDIRLVTEWVRDNIAGFGGDPDRVVLYGQSAGANAVASYGYAYLQDPIVKGLIASSGSVSTTNPTANLGFHDLAQMVGCANLTSAAELACMQKPIADGVTLFANTTDRLEKGLVAKVGIITGYTFNEGAAFLPFDPNATAPPSPAPLGGNRLACADIPLVFSTHYEFRSNSTKLE
ncbi:uncharacterized protein THITE_2147701 [Thermothielavioides terrestris NRRL 8126]|uniref:Carboxylic ester hydrolase n=1 Tax=Thermothielavioides terrestris (strain ATCC 38088 / NRRL 8126) TaxID=578455 RepID=G2RG47_THETT|nr:uncharacterized protein THITE_2147701 [Thermothielavioides terrestris NRRL 8126]AEO70986.1 hypothetical protein THITE_2147701 [Thermothielavioides terrestris NRRL 8126]